MQNFNPFSVWQPAGSDQRIWHFNFVHIFLLVVCPNAMARVVDWISRGGIAWPIMLGGSALPRAVRRNNFGSHLWNTFTPMFAFLTSYLNLSSINNSKEKGWAMHVWKSALRGATTQQHSWFGIDAIHTATCYHQSLSDGQWIRVVFCIFFFL